MRFQLPLTYMAGDAEQAVQIRNKVLLALKEVGEFASEGPFQLPEEQHSNSVVVFTDGGCKGPGKKGAWAFVILNHNGQHIENSGGSPATTNNRMELTAVLEAMKVLQGSNRPVRITSDSQYVVRGTGWVDGWKAKNWKNADGKETSNIDLWQQFLDLRRGIPLIRFEWVKGHAGHEHNERCDELCGLAMQAIP